MIMLDEAAAQCAKAAFAEVIADPKAYGIERPWNSVDEWIDYEIEGDDVHRLAREFDVGYYEARKALIAALKDVASLDELNAPFGDKWSVK